MVRRQDWWCVSGSSTARLVHKVCSFHFSSSLLLFSSRLFSLWHKFVFASFYSLWEKNLNVILEKKPLTTTGKKGFKGGFQILFRTWNDIKKILSVIAIYGTSVFFPHDSVRLFFYFLSQYWRFESVCAGTEWEVGASWTVFIHAFLHQQITQSKNILRITTIKIAKHRK